MVVQNSNWSYYSASFSAKMHRWGSSSFFFLISNGWSIVQLYIYLLVKTIQESSFTSNHKSKYIAGRVYNLSTGDLDGLESKASRLINSSSPDSLLLLYSPQSWISLSPISMLCWILLIWILSQYHSFSVQIPNRRVDRDSQSFTESSLELSLGKKELGNRYSSLLFQLSSYSVVFLL